MMMMMIFGIMSHYFLAIFYCIVKIVSNSASYNLKATLTIKLFNFKYFCDGINMKF